MKKITQSLKEHTNPKLLIGSTIGSFFVFLIVTPIFFAGVFAYEYWTSDEYWLDYQKVTPATPTFKEGEVLRFHSFAEIKKTQDIQWFDTLRCHNGQFETPYRTQILPEQPKPISPTVFGLKPEQAWSYTEEPIRADEQQCKVCGVVKSYTPQFGVEKIDDWGCSEWFEVNQ